jgi:hypothetical protein
MQSLAGYAVIVQEIKHGAGRHMVYLSPQTAKTGLLLNFITQPIYLYAIAFVKISIGLFLLRFAQDRKYRVFIKSVIGTPPGISNAPWMLTDWVRSVYGSLYHCLLLRSSSRRV